MVLKHLKIVLQIWFFPGKSEPIDRKSRYAKETGSPGARIAHLFHS